jgi:hypothetical protein
VLRWPRPRHPSPLFPRRRAYAVKIAATSYFSAQNSSGLVSSKNRGTGRKVQGPDLVLTLADDCGRANRGRPTPVEVIQEVQSTPHGAAAIAAKADVGLLHFVTALDKAGIDAEILPTAVSINKRVADGDKGHSASIEREAGLGAVTALDAYRARVIEAIKNGKSPPVFDADLVKLARAHQRAAAKVKHWKSLRAHAEARRIVRERAESAAGALELPLKLVQTRLGHASIR